MREIIGALVRVTEGLSSPRVGNVVANLASVGGDFL